jgi:5S rRNA maturation endonuclease (ribonuclease M5)
MHADIIRLLIEKGYIKTIKKKITMEDGTEFEVVNSGFIWVDEDYKTVGLSLSGNYVQKGKKRFKGMLNESDGRYGFNLKFCDKPDTIIFCEGCEDMISFCQLYSERVQHCHMVAMTGIKDETVEYYAERYPYSKLILAVDNDDAGKNFVKKIKKIYKDRTVIDYTEQFATKNPTLTFKDWNEVLINSKEDFKDSYLPFELLRKTDIDEKIDKMPKTEEKPLNQFTF